MVKAGKDMKLVQDRKNRQADTYDPVGNITQRAIDNGQLATQYSFDKMNRMDRIIYPNTSTVAFAYDPNRNLLSVSSALSVVTFSYDSMNRLSSITQSVQSVSSVVTYSYDLNGNRVGITYPGNLTVSNAYDAANRLTSVTDWNTNTTTYSYNAVHSPTNVDYPNNVN